MIGLRKRKALVGLIVLLLGSVAVLAGWQLQRQRATAAADAAALEIFFAQNLPDAEARLLRFAEWHGKPLVVNFWATWCAPCVEEMPELSELQTAVGDRVRFVGIGIDNQDRIAAFAKKLPVSYPLAVASATGAHLAGRFGNPSGYLPYTVVIDAAGKVRQRIIGRVQIEELRTVLNSAELR